MKKKLFTLGRRFIQHELIQGSTYLFVGTFSANILAFLFNLLVVRGISTNNYGEYASLMSLFSLAIMPATAFTTVIIRFATTYFTNNEFTKAKTLYEQLTVFVFIVGSCIIFASIVLGPSIQSFLHIQNTFYLFWIGGIVALSYLGIVNTAFLQSVLQFGYIALITFLGSLFKLIGGYIFLTFSLQLQGVFLAIFLSGAFSYLLSFFPLRFLLQHKKTNNHSELKKIALYALPASFTTFALSSLTATDVILVKHFFSPHQAGIYAGLSLIGRIIFYLTVPISSVMFPLAIKRFHKGENVISLLVIALFLVLFPAFCLTCIYFLFPSFVIQVFLGGKDYLSAHALVGFFGIYISIFSAINILVNFFLSLSKMKVAYIIGVGAFFQAILISVYHQSLFQPISISIIISLVILATLLLYYVRTYASLTQKEEKNLTYSSSL